MGDPNQIDFSFSISEPRHNLYKAKGESTQKKRRDEYLKKLKGQRQDLTQYARALALNMPIPDDGSEQPVRDEIPQEMEAENTIVPSTVDAPADAPMKPRRKTAKEKYMEQLLLPEPLVDIPPDLETGWFAVPCPVGTRCMVISSRNSTCSRGRNGAVINKFSSALPWGSASARGKAGDYCILDCIFHEPSSTYFVLDMMCWKGYSLYNCTTDFRFYWVITKLQETTSSTESPTNPYKFIPLPFYTCDRASLHAALSESSDSLFPKSDVVFYNKEMDYTVGYTPLVCVLSLKTEESAKIIEKLLSGEVGMKD